MFKDIGPKWLKSYNKKMEELDEFIARKTEVSQWQEWYAWRPVKMKGKYVWLKKIYRRCINTYVDHDDWKRYEYGTAFDVIRGDNTLHVGQEPPKPAPPPRKV